ncbi:MAG: response regulator transcription factor [Acidaminococcaceae bacterium]
MDILLAEDDLRLGNLTKYMLQDEGYKVTWVTRGDTALIQAADSVYDIIILDWMMPGQDGAAVCKSLRSDGFQKPVLLLTAKDAVSDRVIGLDAGADDYLVKPFEFSELFARLRALSRRGEAPIKDEIVCVGPITLNRSDHTVYRAKELIHLSTREFKLLDLLVRNRGHVVARDIIFDRIWGLNSDTSENIIESYVRLLRKKLEAPDGDILIKTVRGVGYKVDA